MLLFQFLGVGEGVLLGEKKSFTRIVYSMILGWFGDQKNSASGRPKVGGGGVPRLGHNPKFVWVFLVTPPLR